VTRLVVFDIDDTLYLERDYVASGFCACEAATAISGLAATCWSLFCGGVRGSTFNAALERLGVAADAALIARMVAVYRSHTPTIRLLRDADQALGAVAASALTGLVSDGPADSQQAKVDALGLAARIDRIILTATLGDGFGKPHPRAFEQLMRETSVGAARCVYIADNPAKDFAAPRLLGWRTIRIRRAGQLHETVASGTDVDEEHKTFASIIRVLGF
jgi:putative hydrolase of the HAD superfamily